MKRLTVLAAFAALTLCRPVAAQENTKPELKVTSCAAADSLLGPLGGDRKALVRGAYNTSLWRVELATGPFTRQRWGDAGIRSVLWIPGNGPATPRDLLESGEIFFQIHLAIWDGKTTKALLATPGLRPTVSLLLGDSTVIVPIGAKVGTYIGPPKYAIAPVDIVMNGEHLVALAKASKASIIVDSTSFAIPGSDLRDLRGMTRVALCQKLT